VGGGGEIDGGWSDTPYRWLVNQADNKSVGIISYSDEDDWLPNYFIELGANEAVNIKIDSRELANEAIMLDSLTQYDALFFKGGDQSRYYDYYKNTRVQEAVESIYNGGGVIGGTSAGMAILSGVMFPASNGSAFPYDALTDINSEFMTLENDFLSFYPDYIFDSHFIERGRTSRLIGFLANWYENQNQLINGIGVDDRTAFCIDENAIGTVFGTGAASIYHPKEFQVQEGEILNSIVTASQITHGQSYDLNTAEVQERNLANESEPQLDLPYYQVFATHESLLSRTDAMLEEVLSKEKIGGKIVLIANANDSKIEDYQEYFQENTSSEIVRLEISNSENQEDQIELRNEIKESSLLVFIDPNNLDSYFSSGATGELLKNHMKRNAITNVLLGDVANQIGRSYANNIYQDPLNAYFDDLEFSEGLRLLEDFNLITEAYGLDDKDYYENITSAVVDRVLNDNSKYGIYLTGNTYFSYTIDQNDRAFIKMDGDLSSVMIENFGTRFEQTEQTVSGSRSRMQYAFDSLRYSINKGRAFEIGFAIPAEQEAYEFEEVLSVSQLKNLGISLVRNPISNYLRVRNSSSKSFKIEIYTIDGKPVFESVLQNQGLNEFYVGSLSSSRYIMIVSEMLTRKKYQINIIKTE
jgi:cyanophycinase